MTFQTSTSVRAEATPALKDRLASMILVAFGAKIPLFVNLGPSPASIKEAALVGDGACVGGWWCVRWWVVVRAVHRESYFCHCRDFASIPDDKSSRVRFLRHFLCDVRSQPTVTFAKVVKAGTLYKQGTEY